MCGALDQCRTVLIIIVNFILPLQFTLQTAQLHSLITAKYRQLTMCAYIRQLTKCENCSEILMDDSSRAYQCQTNKEGRPCQDVFLTLGTKYVGPDKCPPCVTKGEERKKKAKEAGR
ncbi:unnamed protein product [Fusarium graminearum]|nr:unnamed protein product [Fusarium graminearum]